MNLIITLAFLIIFPCSQLQSKTRCSRPPLVRLGPAPTATCSKDVVRLYTEKQGGGVWKLIKAPTRSPPPPSPAPPPQIVNVEVPKVAVSLQLPYFTVETFGNNEKTIFCNDLLTASNYPQGMAKLCRCYLSFFLFFFLAISIYRARVLEREF